MIKTKLKFLLRFQWNHLTQRKHKKWGAVLALELVERAGEEWRLREPLDTPADRGRIEDLLSDHSYLRSDGFVDRWLCDPYSLRFQKKPGRYAIRWFAR